ncbi:MAG: hypothetical protein Q7T85_11690 [Nitrosomonas sp.]|nr:hypothetical protein [Nitrosomonas sp.]
MKIKDLFENWNLTGLRINAPFMEMDWKPSDPDKEAAWDLYVELLTAYHHANITGRRRRGTNRAG